MPELIKAIDGVKYVFIPLDDLNKQKEISVYIHNIEKFKKCARKCPALSKLKELISR